MRYAVVKHRELRDTVAHVNAAIRDGWMPMGGIAYGAEGYAQALWHPGDRPLPLGGIVQDYEPTEAT